MIKLISVGITPHQKYVNKMAEQIKQSDFVGAAKTHEEWADKDFVSCLDGLFEVEAKIGSQLYERYEDYVSEH